MNGNGGNGKKTGPASEKQVKYLIDLAAQNGKPICQAISEGMERPNPYDLTRDACLETLR